MLIPINYFFSRGRGPQRIFIVADLITEAVVINKMITERGLHPFPLGQVCPNTPLDQTAPTL